MTARINPPMPPLSEDLDFKTQCCACQEWHSKGYFYDAVFICDGCAFDGDGLAWLAWELLQRLTGKHQPLIEPDGGFSCGDKLKGEA